MSRILKIEPTQPHTVELRLIGPQAAKIKQSVDNLEKRPRRTDSGRASSASDRLPIALSEDQLLGGSLVYLLLLSFVGRAEPGPSERAVGEHLDLLAAAVQ